MCQAPADKAFVWAEARRENTSTKHKESVDVYLPALLEPFLGDKGKIIQQRETHERSRKGKETYLPALLDPLCRKRGQIAKRQLSET